LPSIPWVKNIIESIICFANVARNLKGKATRWNEGAVRSFGWTADVMLGRPASTSFTPEDNAIGRPQSEIEEALLYGRSIDERWHIRKNGERFWSFGKMMQLHAANG